MTDLIVVGAGLTGLSAAWFAARKGARVLVIAYGRGGLELSPGCLGVAAGVSPRKKLAAFKRPHPYALVGSRMVEQAFGTLLPLLDAEGHPYAGSLDANLRLPTAAGSLMDAAFAPAAVAAFDLGNPRQLAIAGFFGFRDFDSTLAARRLSERLGRSIAAIDLPLPPPSSRRDRYATDLARLFEDGSWREAAASGWRSALVGISQLGLPAVLGMQHHQQVWQDMQDRLALSICEIPTLPPSMPGLRLEWVLRHACQEAGVDFVEGSRVVGRVSKPRARAHAAGVVASTAGGPRPFEADAVLLATGDLLHGGLVARQSGLVQESVFDLPVVHNPDRSTWVSPRASDTQPYATFGLRVDTSMRPLDADGRPMLSNLFAAGGLIAGARRAEEGSRQGIGIATAYCAVEAALS